MATYLSTQELLNVHISCFANYNTPSNPKSIKLITWLTSSKYSAVQERILAETNKSKRDADKATLPAITPSAECTYREASKVIRHSGFLQFDIDKKDNLHVRNYSGLKEQIAKLPFVAYCGRSVSGTGYWGLVPIAYPERHGQHFDALKRVFGRYNIVLDDKPRSVVSLRGYSYDPNAYFAQQVMTFDLYDEPLPPPVRTVDFSQFTDEDDAKLVIRIVGLVEEAGEGNRHGMLLKAARLAGGYVAAGRLDEQTIVCALETITSMWPMFSKSQKTIRDGIKYGETAPIYPQERTTPLIVNSKTHNRPTYKTYKSLLKPEQVDEVILNADFDSHIAPTVISQEDDVALLDEPTAFRLPKLIEAMWVMFIRPPLRWNKVAAHKALMQYLPPDDTQQVVTSTEEQLANPGSLIRPAEAQLEREVELVCEEYPASLDEPSPPGATPTINMVYVREKETFYQWQCRDNYHSQLGLASLPPKQS